MTDSTPAPLTADERAALLALHVANERHPGYPDPDAWFCNECWSRSRSLVRWPCHVVRALVTVDAAEQRATDAEADRDRLVVLAETAEADAAALEHELAAEREWRERAERSRVMLYRELESLSNELAGISATTSQPAEYVRKYERLSELHREHGPATAERERDEVIQHHVSCTMTVVEREADLRTERDEARRWSALWKRTAASKRRVVRRELADLMKVSGERQAAKRERDAARAQVAALRAAIEYVVDGLEHQSMIDVEAADYLRAALAAAPEEPAS